MGVSRIKVVILGLLPWRPAWQMVKYNPLCGVMVVKSSERSFPLQVICGICFDKVEGNEGGMLMMHEAGKMDFALLTTEL